jgi:hypothetical protein
MLKSYKANTPKLKITTKTNATYKLYDILRASPWNDAITGTHFANRILQHKDKRAGDDIPGISAAGKALGGKLIQCLEEKTGKSVAEFNRQQSDKYIKTLSSVAMRKASQQFNIETDRGTELLSSMRSRVMPGMIAEERSPYIAKPANPKR